MASAVFSSPKQLDRIRTVLSKYASLPFSTDTIPGAVMEAVLANVRGGEVLRTYDFVDVIRKEDRVGWQVKSTKAATPVTWKRAKIPNAEKLIAQSKNSDKDLQSLGNAIIDFCNQHALASLNDYDLDEIGYARLILHDDGKVTYFERCLCTRKNPRVFNAEEFLWRWSTPKKTTKKEQLQALHGIHRQSKKKWWAWHGLGENQLHFSGEGEWWPSPNDPHIATFRFPSADERVSLEALIAFLERADLKS